MEDKVSIDNDGKDTENSSDFTCDQPRTETLVNQES